MRWIYVNVRQQFVQHLITTHPSVCMYAQTKPNKTQQKINLWPLNSFKLILTEKIGFQWSVYCWQFFSSLSLSCIVSFDDIEIKCFDFIAVFRHRNYRHVFLWHKKTVEKNSEIKKEQTRPWQKCIYKK